MSSHPVYILDDSTIYYSKEDVGHVEYWEKEICLIVSKRYSIDFKVMLNLPYCIRRARIVNDILFCGDNLSLQDIKRIEAKHGSPLRLIYDDHERRCDISHRIYKGLKS